MTPENLARLFHETYERLAPDHGYKTRKASAVPWDDVPEANKSLMIAVAAEILPTLLPGSPTTGTNTAADRPPHMAEHGVAYETDTGRYVIADQGGWLPGSYNTEGAAHLAIQLDDNQLVTLRERINIRAGRAITVADICALLDRQADTERAHDLSHVPPKGAADA